MLRVNGVAGLCCGALSGGDVDAGGGGGGVLGGDDRTCAGSCGGGGDCCVVAVGKVVVVPVRRCCVAGSEGPGAGGADAMDGDSEGWEPVAGGVTFWTGIEGSVAVVVTCWTSGVGSDGACCGSEG